MKYSDYFMESLKDAGYTTCYYLGGGNSMHLLESASKYFDCIPVVHEVTAAIAAEYFNVANSESEKAFALVTAGPGLTNLVTGIAGAWLDSRELLVVGGQAKSTNLSYSGIRQIGHQEIKGTEIVKPICKIAETLSMPISNERLYELVSQSWLGRKGTVFIEVCLDVSAQEVTLPKFSVSKSAEINHSIETFDREIEIVSSLIKSSYRPLVLLGGGVSRLVATQYQELLAKFQIPIACTWTGADRCTEDYPYYAGRPNTYGMRWANIFQQQSDLLIAVGTSLGFQQTGFNTEEFMPIGKIIHIDIDKDELSKTNPKERIGLNLNAADFLNILREALTRNEQSRNFEEWINFLKSLRKLVPQFEDSQKSFKDPFVSPHEVITLVSNIAENDARIVAASSGGTFTATMQNYRLKGSQLLIGNKGLASMGYGLAGAIGLAKNFDGQVILFEGDGGFAQNMQDLGTVVANNLNIKIFLTSNNGYASIRTSQASYFDGHYLGCDAETGLFLPDWQTLFGSFGIPCHRLNSNNKDSNLIGDVLASTGPAAVIIEADPAQMYLPKITSRIFEDGKMASSPLHLMHPDLPSEIEAIVFKYFGNQNDNN